MDNVIVKFVADTDGLKPAIDQMLLLGKITEDDAKKIAAINAEQKQFIQSLNQTATEAGKLTSEMEDLNKIIQQEVMAGMAEELAAWTAESKNAVGGAKSLKAELRELKSQIASGVFKGEELKQMTKRAAELTDHLGDVNDKIKALASDTKRIDALVTSFRGLAAATSVVTGAMGLLGSENKELEKQMLKVQSAMALLNGVQEIATLITTENAAKTLILDGAQKAVAVSARVMGVSIATASAVATAGLTVLIGAIAYLITEMAFAEDESAKLARQLEETAGNEDLILRNSRLRAEMIKDSRERELAILKQAYVKEKLALLESKADADHIEQTTILLHKKYLQDVDAVNEKYAKAEEDKAKAHYQKMAKIRKDADDKFIQQQQLSIRDQIAGYQILEQETSDPSKKMEYYAEITRLRKAQLELDKNLTANERILHQISIDNQLRAYQESFNKRSDMDVESWNEANDIKMEASLDWWERYFEVEDAYLAKLNQKRKDNAKMWTSFAIEQAEVVSNTLFQINANRLQEETNNLIESLNTRRDAVLNNQDLTDSQRLKIEKRYQMEEARLKQQAYESQKNADIAQAIINGALAISKAWATVPPPANIPAAIAAGVATAAQVAVIQSTPIPKFAKGVLNLQGPGTSTSDSIDAKLSVGESVMTAQTTADYFPVLKAIHNGDVDPSLANNIITQLAMGIMPQSNGGYEIDYDKLANVMQKGKSKVIINVNKTGVDVSEEKAGGRLTFRNSKLRLTA